MIDRQAPQMGCLTKLKCSRDVGRDGGSLHHVLAIDECIVRVHDNRVKNVTFSASERLIEAARLKASQESRTLNEAFRSWLESYVSEPLAGAQFDDLHRSMKSVRSGRLFDRDELNER